MFVPLFMFSSFTFGLGAYLALPLLAGVVALIALPLSFYCLARQASASEMIEPTIESVVHSGHSLYDVERVKTSGDLEIEQICGLQIPELLERLPYNSNHEETFTQERGQWRFTLHSHSAEKDFYASSLGATPSEAFEISKRQINHQLSDWHKIRFLKPISHRTPRVLIVDDDTDLALAMQTALVQLGCETEIVTRHQDLHRKLSFDRADYIFLDWMLNDRMTADKVIEKASRLIGSFSELREKFIGNKPRVVTYSVLDRNETLLPASGEKYFEHLDHWQKPMGLSEIVERATTLLAVH